MVFLFLIIISYEDEDVRAFVELDKAGQPDTPTFGGYPEWNKERSGYPSKSLSPMTCFLRNT
jgi:hypothetical protein